MRSKKRLNPLLFILMSGLIVYFIVTYFRQQEEFSLFVPSFVPLNINKAGRADAGKAS